MVLVGMRDDKSPWLAQLSIEYAVMSDAALEGDFDEARFRASLISKIAENARMVDIASTCHLVEALLGPSGTRPSERYVHAVRALGEAIYPDRRRT